MVPEPISLSNTERERAPPTRWSASAIQYVLYPIQSPIRRMLAISSEPLCCYDYAKRHAIPHIHALSTINL
jgi:hypothetical protein